MSPLARCQAVTTVDFPETRIRCQLPADHKGDHEHYDGEPAPVTWASAELRPALTIGELHARAKALGLKAAGAIEPIAFAAFSASAEALGETGDRSAWRELGSVHRRAWRSAVLAALEAFPEPLPATMRGRIDFDFENDRPEGGLKPGDVVSMRGVVNELDDPHPYVSVRIDGYRGFSLGASDWMDTAAVTFIERPAPPEPTWAPGDLAEDRDGDRYVALAGGIDLVWAEVATGTMLSRSEIPGPLHKLTVTRQDAP